MKFMRAISLWCLALWALMGLTGEAIADTAPPFKAGVRFQNFTPAKAIDWRGAQKHVFETSIWYPADQSAVVEAYMLGAPGQPLFVAGKAAQNAKLSTASEKYPLIVLSHGSGSTAGQMAWLGTVLAAHGYIVAAANHPGGNAIDPITFEGFALFWERPTDLSALIDAMLGDSVFGPHIDPRRIAAGGFSIGGYTAIALAGGIANPDLLGDFCRSPKADALCAPFAEMPDFHQRVDHMLKTDAGYQAKRLTASKSRRDPRVRAAFAIAPALGPAFTVETLAAISIPVTIVAGETDPMVPVNTNAAYFGANIPGAKLDLLKGGVEHFTFLAPCTANGRKYLPAFLCDDKPSVDRDVVHADVAARAVTFFDTHLN